MISDMELSASEKFQIVKMRTELQALTKDQLIEFLIEQYRLGKVKDKFFIREIKVLTQERLEAQGIVIK